MKAPTSFYISTDKFGKAQEIVDSGEFDNMSDLIRYSMRLFSESLRMIEEPQTKNEVRKDFVKVSLRSDEFVIDSIMGMELYERSTIAEQSLGFYLQWRDRFIRGSD